MCTLNFDNKNPIFIEFYGCNVKSMCLWVCMCWTIQALWSQFYGMRNWREKKSQQFSNILFIRFVDKMECSILSMWRDVHKANPWHNIIVFTVHTQWFFSHSFEIEPYHICVLCRASDEQSEFQSIYVDRTRGQQRWQEGELAAIVCCYLSISSLENKMFDFNHRMQFITQRTVLYWMLRFA